MSYFGGKTNLETLNKTQIYTLMFAAFVSYLVMIMCGTLGAPTNVASHLLECGAAINNCTLKTSMKNQIQICQSASDVEFHNKNELVHLSFHFELDPAKFQKHAYLNTSMVIFDSTEQALLDYCETDWFQIGKENQKLNESLDYGYGVVNETKNLIIKVEGCDGSDSHKEE